MPNTATEAQGSPSDVERRSSALDWKVMGPLFGIVCMDMTSSGVVLPLLPFYSLHYGATPFVVGMLLSTYFVCQFFAGPWLGALSDRWGRKPVLIASQLGTLGGLVLLASARSLPLIFAARIIDGLTSGNISVASARAVDVSGPGARKQAIGVISAGIGVGLVLGPALSAIFASHEVRRPIWVAAILSACTVVATSLLLPGAQAPHHSRPGGTGAGKAITANTLPMMGVLLLFYLAFSLFLSQLALVLSARFAWHGHAFGPREVGLAFAMLGASNVLVQLVVMKWIGTRLSNRALACGSLALLATGLVELGFSRGVAGLIPSMLSISLGASCARPVLTAVLSLVAPAGRQGAILGVNSSLMAAASIAAPLIGGVLIGAHAYAAWTAATVCAAGLASIGTAVILSDNGRTMRETRRLAAESDTPKQLPKDAAPAPLLGRS